LLQRLVAFAGKTRDIAFLAGRGRTTTRGSLWRISALWRRRIVASRLFASCSGAPSHCFAWLNRAHHSGPGCVVHHSKIGLPMSQLGQKRRAQPSPSRAAFTVSRPIPLLAPTISTLATVSMLPVPSAHRHVRCRQPYRKIANALPGIWSAQRKIWFTRLD
jgi:hypothetical protein